MGLNRSSYYLSPATEMVQGETESSSHGISEFGY